MANTTTSRPRRALNPFEGRPLLTSVSFVIVGVMPLYLTVAQVVSLDESLDFDAARLGLATGLYFGLAAALARPVGATVSLVGARVGLRIGGSVALVASAAALTATAWWMLMGAVAAAGLANAFMQVSSNVMLAAKVRRDRQGLSFGAKQAAIPLASALSGALLPSLGATVGWRSPYALSAVMAVISIWLAPRVDGSHAITNRGSAETDTSMSRSMRFLAAGGSFGGAAGNGLALLVVPSAVDIGTSEAAAGTLLAIGSALVFVVRITAGMLADRTHSAGQREMAVLLGLGSAATMILALEHSSVLFLITIPVALMGCWGWPGLAYFSAVRIHPEATARASGMLLSSNLTGTLIGPVVVGVFANRGEFVSAWIFCAALAFCGSLFMLASLRSQRRS